MNDLSSNLQKFSKDHVNIMYFFKKAQSENFPFMKNKSSEPQLAKILEGLLYLVIK